MSPDRVVSWLDQIVGDSEYSMSPVSTPGLLVLLEVLACALKRLGFSWVALKSLIRRTCLETRSWLAPEKSSEPLSVGAVGIKTVYVV